MSTQWILEIPIIVRTWINDLSDSPTYSDDRLQQVILVAGQYVTREINFDRKYTCDILSLSITPDPSLSSTRDDAFITFVALKSACILDQSTFRTKAAGEGIRAGLGAASVSVAGNLKGYKEILDVGPCALYEKLRMEYEVGNANAIQAVLSPFVGNNFDARSLNREHGRSRDFFS
tara:strand:+ start:1188 stop:1715 length:528 start_codon:yes stop_codon:yes gene_type:complete